VEKLEALIAAFAVVMLVSIWIRTAAMLTRIRSLALALSSLADGLRPLVESAGGGAANEVEKARRALVDAQEILASAIEGTDGHEIEVRAGVSPHRSAEGPRIVERRVSEILGASSRSTHYPSARM
jgi:hypothetical protein